jgi:hypothetical protein
VDHKKGEIYARIFDVSQPELGTIADDGFINANTVHLLGDNGNGNGAAVNGGGEGNTSTKVKASAVLLNSSSMDGGNKEIR